MDFSFGAGFQECEKREKFPFLYEDLVNNLCMCLQI